MSDIPTLNIPIDEADEADLIRFVSDCQRYLAESRGHLPRETLAEAVKAARRLRQRLPQKKKPKASEGPAVTLDDLIG